MRRFFSCFCLLSKLKTVFPVIWRTYIYHRNKRLHGLHQNHKKKLLTISCLKTMLCIFDAHKNYALTEITSRMKFTFLRWKNDRLHGEKINRLFWEGWGGFREKSKLLRLVCCVYLVFFAFGFLIFFYCHANYSLKHECVLNQFFLWQRCRSHDLLRHAVDDIILMFQNSFNTLQNFLIDNFRMSSFLPRKTIVAPSCIFLTNFLVLLLKDLIFALDIWDIWPLYFF